MFLSTLNFVRSSSLRQSLLRGRDNPFYRDPEAEIGESRRSEFYKEDILTSDTRRRKKWKAVNELSERCIFAVRLRMTIFSRVSFAV